MKFRSPSVKLINNPNMYDGFDLWMKSREAIITQGKDEDHVIIGGKEEYLPDYKNNVLKLNLQFNNFPFYVFEIEGSLLSRDVFFNITEIYQWSTSLRFFHSLTESINFDAFQVSEEFKGMIGWEDQMNIFLNMMKDDSIHPDTARLQMPYSVSTRYWIGCNLKILTSFLGFMKIQIPWFYETYGKLIIQQVPEIEKYIPPFIDDIYQKYLLPKVYNPGKVEVNDYIFLNTEVGMILFSQFIRQSSATVSGLYDFLGNDFPSLIKGDTDFKISYTAHKKRFMRTVSNRTCAFSMSDDKSTRSWYHILEPYLKDMDLEDFKELLPCSYEGNKLSYCKMREDIKFRNNKFEKNLPCPMLCHSTKVAKKRYEKSDTSLNRLYLELTETLEPSDVNLPYDYEDQL